MSKTIHNAFVAMIAALTIGSGILALSTPALARMDETHKSSGAKILENGNGLEGTGLDAIVGVAMLGAFLGSALDSPNAAAAGSACRQAGTCRGHGASSRPEVRRIRYVKPQ